MQRIDTGGNQLARFLSPRSDVGQADVRPCSEGKRPMLFKIAMIEASRLRAIRASKEREIRSSDSL